MSKPATIEVPAEEYVFLIYPGDVLWIDHARIGPFPRRVRIRVVVPPNCKVRLDKRRKSGTVNV